eukprot:TRINITY_DN63518_c0_g1_i1.p1 TRINITY_DN63518_c0_g1~~TRINITY_DN63518_c0_g1_i1.p1  ORF type:complete len:615 (+),score=55.68 TRINITY_DN63518_c0_g1_i1:214-1845(+)
MVYTYETCCVSSSSTAADVISDCRRRDQVDVSQLPGPVRCAGTPWVSADDWDSLFHAHKLSQVVGSSFQGWPDIPALLRKANGSLAARAASEADCTFGLVTALLHALPSIDRNAGTNEALRAYVWASRLRGGASDLEASDCRWGEMVNHNLYAHYPFVLGGEPRLRARCPEGAPRIFVYDTGDIAERPLSCARTGFWASEVYVDRFFRYSACRVHDAREADFFFIPAYWTCWELQKVYGLDAESKEREAEKIAQRIRELAHWHHREGLDHVFLFGASAWQMPGWRELLGRSPILAVESRPIIKCDDDMSAPCWHCEDCFQPWKDLVIPPVTPLAMLLRLLGTSQPVSGRTIIMSWHGQHANASDPKVAMAYRLNNETVRLALMELAGLKNVSLGGPVPNYAAVMSNSHFCLCPKGASSYTSRVFEALFAGCVPVILSDDVRLPFDSIVDWTKFSIRWPMAHADARLYDYLAAFIRESPERLLAMQHEVARVRCWFDYFGTETDPLECSPYSAILKLLGMRARVAPLPRPAFAVDPQHANSAVA